MPNNERQQTIKLFVINFYFQVVSYAPSDPWGSDYSTDTMNIIDHILSNVGKSNDGLGEFWSPIERVVHNFHMWDLWVKIQV